MFTNTCWATPSAACLPTTPWQCRRSTLRYTKRKRSNRLKYTRTRATTCENVEIENVRSVAISSAWVYNCWQFSFAALPEMWVSRLGDLCSASRTLANMMCFPMPRRREPEWMDQPGLDEAEHHQALSGLSELHRVRSTVGPLWKVVREVARRQAPVPLSVLDIACGGGDVLVQLARRARASGLHLQLAGCDLRPAALRYARQRAEAADVSDIDFFATDVLQEPLPRSCDIVLCTLFLHHLDEPDAVALLRKMAAAARQVVLVEDLIRSRLGLGLTWIGCHLLSRSPIVRVDGPRSVRAAFTPREVRALATQAELDDARLSCHWPQRLVLQWRRS